MLLDILNIMAPPLGRSDACVERMELYTRNADSTKRPRNRGVMRLDILNVMAQPLGRSDAYVELMGLDARNADSAKRPRNRSGDAT